MCKTYDNIQLLAGWLQPSSTKVRWKLNQSCMSSESHHLNFEAEDQFEAFLLYWKAPESGLCSYDSGSNKHEPDRLSEPSVGG